VKRRHSQELDPSRRGPESQEFEAALRSKIVSQEDAIQAVVALYQVFLAGMCPPGRPVGNLLFLGPTGCGKTRIVEAAAEILFGDPRAVIKLDCAEFQHSHEIAKLIGSPPGYLGHRETHPLITQEALAQYHTEKLSFLLFDEIEKATVNHPEGHLPTLRPTGETARLSTYSTLLKALCWSCLDAGLDRWA
jgi:ATP-dependent Clp protease ATP-binding subunit ClpA